MSDPIDRQAAIDAIRMYPNDLFSQITAIEELPPERIKIISPELELHIRESNHWKPTLQRWISCDEKIPDAPFRVLVQLTNSWMVTAYYEESEWRFVSNEFCGIENEEVVAWMPLPEPYKEGKA